MISKKMTKTLNQQVNAELYSAYLYMSMSSACANMGLKGAANWFHVQTQEEMTHALRIYKYVQSQGEHALLAAIDGPPTEFESLKAMFEASLAHEKKVTAMINNLANLAVEEKDHASGIFLQWFVNEQVEEEEGVVDILNELKLAGEKGAPLLMLDKELASRVFVFPPDLAAKTAV
jgi:ferritin